MNSLVVYFSATGRTASVAEKLAKLAGTDTYEIKPSVKYTKDDLNWMDKESRSSVEMNNRSIRPEIITGDIDLLQYKTIYLGFPIWWYVAPTVINTFLESYNFNGKKIILFATSGGSGFGNTVKELRQSATNADFIEGRLLNGRLSENDLLDVINLA